MNPSNPRVISWGQLETLSRIRNGVDIYDGMTSPRDIAGRSKTLVALLEREFIVRTYMAGSASVWTLTAAGEEFLRRVAACAA